jgi:hypothetical protein
MAKKRTVGFFPTIEGKPGRFCEWDEDGKTVGQICYACRSHPVKLEPTRDKVRSQIHRTLNFRRMGGFARDNEASRFAIERVTAD